MPLGIGGINGSHIRYHLWDYNSPKEGDSYGQLNGNLFPAAHALEMRISTLLQITSQMYDLMQQTPIVGRKVDKPGAENSA